MKRSLRVIALLLLVAMLAACGKKEVPEEEIVTEEPQAVEIQAEEKKKDVPEKENLLTGIQDLTDEAIGKRPVAVMVNNIPAAMPQYGVEQADLIFEIPVEADQTRLMAVYGDYTTLPKICSIRSCRYYYPALALGFDAFYMHWGIDPTVTDYVYGLPLDHFDGKYETGGFWGRDQDRLNAGYALEHTAYFDGTKFAAFVDKEGLRTDLSDKLRDSAFNFVDSQDPVEPEGNDCKKVSLNFGNMYADLTYDEETKTYKKTNCGEPQIDGVTKNQLAFTNVFVLETEISVRDNLGRKKLDWAGSKDATGYYVSAGKVQKIHWYKKNGKETERLVFEDESGNELAINRGKSYIAFNYKDKTTFE